MKANSKRKVFGDAVDLLMGDMEEVTMPRGVQMLPVKIGRHTSELQSLV